MESVSSNAFVVDGTPVDRSLVETSDVDSAGREVEGRSLVERNESVVAVEVGLLPVLEVSNSGSMVAVVVEPALFTKSEVVSS